MPEPEWTIESIVSVLIVGAVIVILLLVAAATFLIRDRVQRPGWAIGAALVAAVIFAIGLWWGMYPWKAECHQWRPVSGMVATVDKRLTTGQTGTMEDKFVVQFQGDSQQYGVLDTRAATLHPGDRATITCVRRWQWSGSHGFDCNWLDKR